MAGWRRAVELAMTCEEIERLTTLSRSRTEPASRVSRAQMLLASSCDARRSTAVSGAPRLPYCMMGVCFDCLVTIDGVGNRQGCLVPVAEGMQIEIQKGKREIGK